MSNKSRWFIVTSNQRGILQYGQPGRREGPFFDHTGQCVAFLGPIYESKAGFIAGQLNSTRRRVELRRRVAMNTSTTQLNSTSRCPAINTLHDASQRRRSVGGRRRRSVGSSGYFRTLRRNCSTFHSYSKSARSRSVTWLLFIP